jgi:UDP-N-acetylmuramoylalanine--D-glutamate ligase
MDYYESFKEYVSCKENITKNQTENDYLIYNEEDIEVKNIASRSKAKKISVKGKYLDLNINAAKEVARLFNIKEDIILDSIKNTKSMEHRMEFVGNFKGIDFYNDSASTIPESTICALDYFKGRVDTLILGGSEKYLDIKKLVERIEKGNVKNLIFFPLTGKKIWEEIKNKDNFKSFFAKNMKEAVEFCFENTEKGKVCLLSPAFASFSVFKDYRERGEKFKEEIFKKI